MRILLRQVQNKDAESILRESGQQPQEGDHAVPRARAEQARATAWRRSSRNSKHQRRLPGFDDNVIGMYAGGMSVREIQAHLLEIYGLEVSPDLISTITDEVLAEVEQWQNRPWRRSTRSFILTRCR